MHVNTRRGGGRLLHDVVLHAGFQVLPDLFAGHAEHALDHCPKAGGSPFVRIFLLLTRVPVCE